MQYYDAKYLFDGDGATAWSEGVPGYGLGEYLELQIPKGIAVTGGEIQPGFYKNENLFYRNGAPTNLIISSGGDSCTADISSWASDWKGKDSVCTFSLDHSIVSDGIVRVEIGGFRAGTQYDDTMISELRLQGYAQNGAAAETMPGIRKNAGAAGGVSQSSGETSGASDSPLAAEPSSEETSAPESIPGNDIVSISPDVYADAQMTCGELKAKYGAETQMVHGLHWCMPVAGLQYEIEFMAQGLSSEGMPYVADGDMVWHAGGMLRNILDGYDSSSSAEAFAEILQSSFSDVSFTMESGAGTGYYLSDWYASFTFLDSQGLYWSLKVDLSGSDEITGDSFAWLGIQ